MKSKYFDYLDSRKENVNSSKGNIVLADGSSPFIVSAVLRKGKRLFLFESGEIKVYFEHFSSLNDFMLSNSFV